MIFPWQKNKSEKKQSPEMHYVKPDDSKTIGKDPLIKKGIFSGSNKWARQDQSIARSISKSGMRGLIHKNIIVAPNEMAVIFQDGQIVDIVESGKVEFSGLLKSDYYSKDFEVVIMDMSPKDANWHVGELWTVDKHEIAAKGLLRYRISDSRKFFTMVFAYGNVDTKGERFLSLEHINERIKSEVLTRVLQPEISKTEIKELYGNRDLQLKIEKDLGLQIEQTLNMMGLELLKYTLEWDLGNYIELIKAKRKFEKEEELKELNTLSRVSDYKQAERIGVADVRSKKAVESEVAEYQRSQKVRDVETDILIALKESESDFEESKHAIETFKNWKQAKVEARVAEVGIDQAIADKEHTRTIERMKTEIEKGGAGTNIEKKEIKKSCMYCKAPIPTDAVYCPACGKKQEPKKRFCTNCGASMPPPPNICPECEEGPPDGMDTKICPNCKEVIPTVAKFCSECGASQPGQTEEAAKVTEISAQTKDDIHA